MFEMLKKDNLKKVSLIKQFIDNPDNAEILIRKEGDEIVVRVRKNPLEIEEKTQ